MTATLRIGGLLVLAGLLAGCATPVVETEQEEPLSWPVENPVLPSTDNRYDVPEPVPAGTRVTLEAPRIQLDIDTRDETRQISQKRLYTDSNGLPLIELPTPPEESIKQGEAAITDLEWTIEAVRDRESRIEIDGSDWLERRTDQLFPSRPVIYVYFYALGSGTQVHLERKDEDQPFPVTVQREILESLYSTFESSS